MLGGQGRSVVDVLFAFLSVPGQRGSKVRCLKAASRVYVTVVLHIYQSPQPPMCLSPPPYSGFLGLDPVVHLWLECSTPLYGSTP